LVLGAVIFLGLMVERVRSQPTIQDSTANNAVQLVTLGRQIFRFDTFGDQAFWGDSLKLHQAIEGSALGGVGPEVNPKTALTVGLKIDVDALPGNLFEQLQHTFTATSRGELRRGGGSPRRRSIQRKGQMQ
jgi:hypothetical protein